MSRTSNSVAQLNIRMSSTVKAAGDATLERMGILPAQIVRAVWQKLSLGEEAAGQLLRSLAQKPSIGEAPYPAAPWDAYDGFLVRREAFWAQMEAAAGPPPAPLSNDEMTTLLFEERLERNQERLVRDAR